VKELQNELDDLSQRLDEAGGATQAQVSETHSPAYTRSFFIFTGILLSRVNSKIDARE